MHDIRALPASTLPHRALAILLAVLLGASMLPLTAFADLEERGTQRPDAPGNVQAFLESDGVHVTWDAVADVDGYSVFRSVAKNGPFEIIFDLNAQNLSCLDQDAAPGGTYYYIVISMGPDMKSLPSNVASVTLPPYGQFHVTYDGAGADAGTVPVDYNTYLAGDLVTVPTETPTRIGSEYTFGGWKDFATGEVYQPGDPFTMPEGGITLTALWAEHAVPGNNRLVLDDETLTAGDTVRFTATGDRQDVAGTAGGETRYIPISWTILPLLDGVELPFDPPTSPYRGGAIMGEPGRYYVMVTYDMQYFNICCNEWESMGPDNHDIIAVPFSVRAQVHSLTYLRNYTPEDAFFSPAGNFAAGTEVPLSDIGSVGILQDDYTRDGYRFMGWSADRFASQGVVGDYLMPSEETALYAIWAREHAVTYDGNGADGGTVPTDPLAYVKDDAVTVASDEPTRAGYKFAGWTADHDGNVYRAGDTFAMPEGDARLVARWTPQAAPGPDNNQAAKPGTPANTPKGTQASASKMGFLPKTGDEAAPFALLGIVAALGASGVHVLRKKKQE